MLREIIEKINLKEMMCPEARDLASKIAKMKGIVTLKRNDGEEFEVDADTAIMGGFIPAKNKKGKHVDLDLCGSHYFKLV